MKQVIATRFVDIPDDVEFEVRARKVKVKGPRGEQHNIAQRTATIHSRWCQMTELLC